MEEFKSLEEVTQIDSRHTSLAQLTGYIADLERMHSALAEIELNTEVPQDVRSQFNVARNMALYSYFLYSLATEVQLKTYIVIEFALRMKAKQEGIEGKNGRPLMLRQLLEIANKNKWIQDKGFRHIEDPSDDNPWCHDMINIISKLRNEQAHGSYKLTPDYYHHIRSCADLLNQLFHE